MTKDSNDHQPVDQKHQEILAVLDRIACALELSAQLSVLQYNEYEEQKKEYDRQLGLMQAANIQSLNGPSVLPS